MIGECRYCRMDNSCLWSGPLACLVKAMLGAQQSQRSVNCRALSVFQTVPKVVSRQLKVSVRHVQVSDG